jgi:hypothetical protein
VLVKQRLKSAAPSTGFPSPRQTDKHWMTRLCNDKQEMDQQDRELLYSIPVPDFKSE